MVRFIPKLYLTLDFNARHIELFTSNMNNETIKKMKSMNTKAIVAVAIILAVLGAGYALARQESGYSWAGMMGGNWNGNGMMGSYGNGITGGSGGMMGNFGNGAWNGMMGYGNGSTAGYRGMMGGNWSRNGMMGYGNGNGYCGAGYAGSSYGVSATP